MRRGRSAPPARSARPTKQPKDPYDAPKTKTLLLHKMVDITFPQIPLDRTQAYPAMMVFVGVAGREMEWHIWGHSGDG